MVGEVGHLALGPAVLSSGVPGSNLNITLGSAHNRPTNRTQNIDMTHFLWLDTSARCMGLVVGRFHKNVLSEGGGFFYPRPFMVFSMDPTTAATMKNLSKNIKKNYVIYFYCPKGEIMLLKSCSNSF